MESVFKNNDALREQYEEAITNYASQILGSQQEQQLGQYIVMMLLDSYVNDDTIKSEIKQMTSDKLGEDFFAWCKEQGTKLIEQNEGQIQNNNNSNTFGNSTQQTRHYASNNGPDENDQEMTDITKHPARRDREKKENPLRSRIDLVKSRGISKRDKCRDYKISGINKIVKSNEHQKAESTSVTLNSIQNTIDKSLPPQERFNLRCKNWPICKFEDCKFVHPTEVCEAFAQGTCSAQLGTCLKVHINEDLDDIQQLPPQPKPFEWKKNQTLSHTQIPKGYVMMPIMTPQGLQNILIPNIHQKVITCRFTNRCGNRDCIFGHPTPCNDNAQISDNYTWCEARENCMNAECGLNHPSSSLIRENPALPTEKTLEPCRFAINCTNFNCRYRHAKTHVLCRDGKECKRLDCFFTHPVEMPCKYSINCANLHCVFEHPPERDEALKTGGVPASHVLRADRKYLDESQPVEKLIPGEIMEE